jgi:signal transduction histidine kinase
MSMPSSFVILIADDERNQRNLMRIDLEGQGYRVVEAPDGQEAVRVYEDTHPDLVLLDMNMPVLSGRDACRAIRQHRYGQKVPIIIITVLDDQETIDEAFDAGATDYITKPVNYSILNQRIRKLLDARRDEKLRDDLVKMLVHDMKTPITAIKLGSEMLIDEGNLDPSMLEIIRDNSLRLLNLVMGVLDTSRLQEGKLHLQRTRREVREVLTEACESFRWMKVTRGITVQMGEVPAGLEAWVDWTLIERVLINLITNAFKHSPNDVPITVSAYAPEPTMLHIIVQDQGEGISPEDQSRIFDQFVIATQRTMGSYLDTGMGLAFCKLVVETHGGSIHVESKLNEGARFVIRLPLLTPSPVATTG